MALELVEGHSILPQFVRPGSVVVDCGANVGVFSVAMARRFHCRCHAIEPVGTNFERIPADPRIIRHNLAVVGRARPVELRLSADATRHSIFEESGVNETSARQVVPGVTLEQFCRDNAIGEIEVLKLDIEGAEFEVIDQASDDFIKRIQQVTIEFHRFYGPTSLAEIDKRIDRICSLGFYELRYTLRRNTADVLLVGKRHIGILRYGMQQYAYRPWRAILRRSTLVTKQVTHVIRRVLQQL